MDVLEAIKGRRATRSYTGEAVSRDVIVGLIDAAIAAPSVMNLQPWSFVIVEGAERLREMSSRAKDYLLASSSSTPSFLASREILENQGFNLFYGAPCLVIVCARPPSRQAMEDCCLAAQNLMLAAHAQELGSCWIGFARPWLELSQTRTSLGLLADQIPVAPIVLGRAATTPQPSQRHRPPIIWN